MNHLSMKDLYPVIVITQILSSITWLRQALNYHCMILKKQIPWIMYNETSLIITLNSLKMDNMDTDGPIMILYIWYIYEMCDNQSQRCWY